MLKKQLLQTLLITYLALFFTFLLFIFKEYYQPIFAIRIFLVDLLGLLAISTLYFLLKPKYDSIIKRSLLVVFSYFTIYEILDNVIYYLKYHVMNRGNRTDLVEAETAVITFIITFLIAFLCKSNQSKSNS